MVQCLGKFLVDPALPHKLHVHPVGDKHHTHVIYKNSFYVQVTGSHHAQLGLVTFTLIMLLCQSAVFFLLLIGECQL